MAKKKPKTVRQYQNEIVRNMKKLGIYREEQRFAIEILAGMFADYDTVVQAYDAGCADATFDLAVMSEADEDAACVFLSTLEDMKWSDG